MRGSAAVLADGHSETVGANLAALHQRFAAAGMPVASETLLAAVATAWAMSIPPELISAGLDTFSPELAA
jgi:cyanophycin synthetase